MRKNKLLPILLAVLLLAGYFFLGGGESPAPVLENAEPAVQLFFHGNSIFFQKHVTFPIPMLSIRVKGPNRKEV